MRRHGIGPVPMLATLPDRFHLAIREGAAHARRSAACTQIYSAELLCSLNRSRCRRRARRDAEPSFRGLRIARDAVPIQAVITVPNSPLVNDFGDSAPESACDLSAPAISGGHPDELSPEQLESRRLRSQSASASTSSLNDDVFASRRLTPPRTSATFPTYPRPPSPAAAQLASPSPSSQIPPEAAQLYARSTVAGNLSSTAGSIDVLTPLLDALQVAPPAVIGSGGQLSYAQRVYRTEGVKPSGVSGGSSAELGDTSSATSIPSLQQVRRKRAPNRVLDRSELLLPRDEAVRTELITRTWDQLLRFEARLSTATTATIYSSKSHASATAQTATTLTAAPPGQPVSGSKRPQSVGEVPSGSLSLSSNSLEDVLGFLRLAVVEEDEKQSAKQEEADEKAAVRSRRMTVYLTQARTWEPIAAAFLKHGRKFSVAQLVLTVVKLAHFDAKGSVPCRSGFRAGFARVWDMITRRLVFEAPRLSGRQVVQVVRAISSLPLRNRDRAVHMLISVQRILRHSQHTLHQHGAAWADGSENTAAAAPAAWTAAPTSGSRIETQADSAALPRRSTGGKRTAGSAPLETSVTHLRTAMYEAVADTDWQVPMTGSDHAKLCYILGRLNTSARPWLLCLRLPYSFSRLLLLGSYSQLRVLSPRDLAGLVYGISCMRLCTPARWMLGFYVTSARLLFAMTDIELSMVIYGACRQRMKPPPPWMEAYIAASAPRLQQADTAFLSTVAHSLGRLKYKPPRTWLEALQGAVHKALVAGTMHPGEMSQLTRGLMFLGIRPLEELQEALWAASSRTMAQGQFSAAQLANLAWSLGLLKMKPPPHWYEQLRLEVRKMGTLKLRPYHRRRLLEAFHSFGNPDLPRWYQLLRIPLHEMPGYQNMLEKQKQQRVAAVVRQQQGSSSSRAAVVVGQQQHTSSSTAAKKGNPQQEQLRQQKQVGST